MKSVISLSVLLIACVLLSGCTTTQTRVTEPGRSLKDVRRFFVLRNLKDNHGIDGRIVHALRTRGFEAESGPITLLPDTAQAVITYEDRWAWDFSHHMVYLKLGVRDPQAFFPYATSSYLRQVAFTTQVDAVVGQVVDALLTEGK